MSQNSMTFDEGSSSSNNLETASQSGSHQKRNSVVYTVEQLNTQIRELLENQLGVVWLKGEISNFKPHSSGHFYFSLKDARAQISAVMFRGHNSRLKFKPHDGLEVLVRGKITAYEPRGTYQIVCDSMEPVGAGALQKQFEQLKEKLKSEGLFEASRKRPLPPFPQHVAIVTSPTGAAIQDILNIMKRRAPHVKITIVPALVQGATAAQSLCESFVKANQLQPDVIIIGRGGGSMEDLWSFNDEKLARLIVASPQPVVSAVGHEVDFTICDFVSDLRAPTPSAAAELVAKNSHEVSVRLKQMDRTLLHSIQKLLNFKLQGLSLNRRRLVDPKKKLQDSIFRNDELLSRLEQAVQTLISHLQKDVQIFAQKLISPQIVINKLQNRREKSDLQLQQALTHQLQILRHEVESKMQILHSLSPLAVVDRGYSITTHQKKIVRSVEQIKTQDEILIELSDGHIKAEVIEVEIKKTNQSSKKKNK